ncbi:ABC transporter ATP-binding protein [Tenacibaculum aiptasiae]|uniref:ABC transporter ATP-binding protein n=1 Tax=Tenacibaculum aiptasiae TaxID=426481 RepID=UPI00233061D3|nr:ATP-binding cassette domain-containing protein [Tenacibaculum aiptasiae]
MIQTENLVFQYKDLGSLLSFPNISVTENESLLILGKSGIGKTTLLHLLAGLLKPSKGKVIIENIDISLLSNSELDEFRGQYIGLVFQKKYTIQSLSVFKNLQTRLFFSKKKVDNNKINNLLEELGIKNCINSKVKELSEGQLQRLNIAMAVVHNPKIILADEPTSSLDDENCKIVIELLKKQAKQHKAKLIVITHDQRIKPFFQNKITLE